MSRSAALVGIAWLLAGRAPVVRGHVYLMEPYSRNFYYTDVFQNWDFEYITYCPHCLQSRGPGAVRARAEANTPADVLSEYGGGAWPLKIAYERGELADNGNFLERDDISVRHGICGDPEQSAAEGSNAYGRENGNYPVLATYQEGSVIKMKVVVSTYHWGHLEFFICDSDDMADGEDGLVTQSCFNMYPLTRATDDGDASPIDLNHPGRYYLDPPCRADETDQTKPTGSAAGYVVTGRYQLPAGLTCDRCIVQMVYYTGNSCTQPGYELFAPESVPSGCAPSASDWVTLDPPPCGEGDAYPEEFWNCADIKITVGGSSTYGGSTSSDDDGSTLASVSEPETPSPVTPSAVTPSPTTTSAMTPSPVKPSPVTPSPVEDVLDDDDHDDGEDCDDPVSAYEQCGGSSWTGSTCCCPGYECNLVDEFYHQCQLASHGDDGCSYLWEQCGGIAWTGPTCCSAGSECDELGEWYSQCVPGVC